MKFCKTLFILLLVMTLTVGTVAFAADSAVVYTGMSEGFTFTPGSGYTESDLFDGFKDVMPGDRLTETIRIQNDATDSDYIKVYLRAIAHDGEGNPLTYSEPFENADGKDQANIDGERDETVATMLDFLAQLSMRVYNGEELIFDASPEELDGLAENVLLGTFRSGESAELTVELDVPAEMGNEYAFRVGEVDWVFTVEAFDDPEPPAPELTSLTVRKVWLDNNDPDRPEGISVCLLKDGEPYDEVVLNDENQWTYTWGELEEGPVWTVEEIGVPEGYTVTYTTEGSVVTIVNTKETEPPAPAEPVDLTVKKVWAGDEDALKDRPDSVAVTLYNGTTAVETVRLGNHNNWTYTWEDLDGSGVWSVLEADIPEGYTPSYQVVDGVVVITNTASLIDTGVNIWPVLILAGLGILLVTFGTVMTLSKRKNGYA